MRLWTTMVAILLVSSPCWAAGIFRRGDANADGELDVSDPVRTILFLFAGGSALHCDDAADSNDDGEIDLADAVFGLEHLFRGGPGFPWPYPRCGADRTPDALGCAGYNACNEGGSALIVPGADLVILDPASTRVQSAARDEVTLVGAVDNLAPGKVLLSCEGQGLLRRVRSIAPSADGAVVLTSEARLTDAFEEARIELARELGYDDFDPSTFQPLLPGVTLGPAEAQGQGDGAGGAQPRVKLKLEVKSQDIPLGDAKITFAGSLTFTLGLNVRIDIQAATLRYLLFEPVFSVEGEIKAEAFGESKWVEKEILVGRVSGYPITIPGPPPVVVTPTVELKLTLKIWFQLGIEVSVAASFSASGGIEYAGGAWRAFGGVDGPRFDRVAQPRAFARIKGELALAPEQSVQLYGVAGPYVALDSPYVALTGEVKANPPEGIIRADVGVKGYAGLKVAALGYDLLDYRSPRIFNVQLNLFTRQFPLDPSYLTPFRRGDVDASGAIEIDDAVGLLAYLLLGGAEPRGCGGTVNLEAADVNDNEHVTIADGYYLLESLFGGQLVIPPPRLECGGDSTDTRAGFDTESTEYQVRIPAAVLTLTPTGLEARVDVEIRTPGPIRAALLAFEPGDEMTWLGFEAAPGLPWLETCPNQQPCGTVAAHETDGLVLLSIETDKSGQALAGTDGAFMKLGTLRLLVDGPGSWLDLSWLPEFAVGGVPQRATVVDAAAMDHHPGFVSAVSWIGAP